MKIIFLEEFGKAFVPKRFRPYLRAYFLKANIEEIPFKLFGGFFYLALFITFVFYFYKVFPFVQGAAAAKVFLYTLLTWTALPLALALVFGGAIYFYLDLVIFNRTKRMEEVLPDFLRLVSENLKGGMPFERAMWSAIKPEFDILSSEVRLAAKRVMTGEDVGAALTEFTEKYNSPMLKRSFELMIEGVKGGARMAGIIDRVIENIEETKELRNEMRATNLTYVIFTTVVVIILAPALFTLAFQFLIILQNFSARIGPATVQAIELPISLGQVTIDPQAFRNFSTAAIATVAFFSSLIVSTIQRGTIRGGIRYVPVFVASALVIYTVLMFVATRVFSSLFAI